MIMKKLKNSSLSLLLILFNLLFAACSQVGTKEEITSEKPNILFIIADDQTYASINSLNNPDIITPNLDRLSDSGITFTHGFNAGAWGGAVCVASRAMINSGQRLWRAQKGVQNDSLWGQVFAAAGYHTFLTGKWHNGGNTALKSFKEIKGIGPGMYETKQGMKGPRYNRIDRKDWHPSDTAWGGQWKPKVRNGIYTDSSYTFSPEISIDQHATEYFSDRAIDFLNARKQGDSPYLMYVSFTAPHDPKQVTQKYLDLYPIEDMKLPASYIDEHPFDQGHHSIRDEIIAPIPRTENAIKTQISEYYAFITHMDEQIGRILNAYSKTHDAKNTYVIFTADHGLAVGKHGLMGKQNMYDHSVRLPFMITGPGIESKLKSDELIYMQSIFATTAELANIKIPSTVEYKSLVPIIENRGEGEKYIYGGYMGFQRMIRNKEFKLILYPHNGMYQLFNIKNDPDELTNIAEGNEKIMNDLFNQLKIEQKKNADTLEIEKYWEKTL